MRSLRSLSAFFAALALAAALLGARESAAMARILREREAEQDGDRVRPVAVFFAPADDVEPEAVDKALTEVERELGDRPREVVDARGLLSGAASARAQLLEEHERWLVGSGAFDGGFQRVFTLEAKPKGAAPSLREAAYREEVPASRPVHLTLFGESLEGDAVRVTVDGADVPSREVRVRGDGSLGVSLPGMAPGIHAIEVAGRGDEPPIRVKIRCLDPPRAAHYGSPNDVAARALTAQGFAWTDPSGVEEPALWLLTDARADFARVAASVRKGAGCLIVGAPAAEGAEASPLAVLLPAKLAARPEPPPEPEKADTKPPDGDPRTADRSPLAPRSPPPPPPRKVEPEPGPPLPGGAPSPVVKKSLDDAPVVALAIVIDKSGSMFGEKLKLARQAALASADVLSPDDFMTVISFDTTPKVEFQLGRVAARNLLVSKLEQISAGGGTRFYNAIVEASNQLTRASLAARHIVLVTDGATEDRWSEDYEGLIRTRLTPDGVTLSTVFIQGEGDQDYEFLRWLAMLGRGQSVVARQHAALPALVLAEVRRRFGIPEGGTRRAPAKDEAPPKPKDEDGKPEPPKPNPTPPKEKPKPDETRKRIHVAIEPGTVVLEGIDTAGLAPIGGFRFLEPVGGSIVFLREAGGAGALLAARAAGEGAVAVLGIDEKDGLELWAGDPRLQQILARVATALTRGEPTEQDVDPDRALRACVDGERLLADGPDPLGLLEPLRAANETAPSILPVGRSASGSTRLGADGRRYSSLRLGEASQEAAAREASRARWRAHLERLGAPPARPPALADPEPRGRPIRAAGYFLGAVVAAIAAAAGARRST